MNFLKPLKKLPPLFYYLIGFVSFLLVPYSTKKIATANLFTIYWGDAASKGIHDDWQHCLLVPFLLIFIIYKKRNDYKHLLSVHTPYFYGLTLTILSLFTYYVGFRANLHYLGYISLQGLLASLIVWRGGFSFFYKVSFLWWFSWFIWPFYFLGRMLGLPLRHTMTWMSEKLLNLLGLDSVREGTAIFSAADISQGLEKGALFQAEVAAACSGLRSLFALMMISALYGFFRSKNSKSQWVYFLSSIPMAIMGNCIRIILIVLATVWFGEDFAIGTHSDEYGEEPSAFHLFAGYIVFIVNILGLILLEKLLKRISWFNQSSNAVTTDTEAIKPTNFFTKNGALVFLLLALFTSLNVLYGRPPAISQTLGVTGTMPFVVQNIQGKARSPSKAEKAGLPQDTIIKHSIYFSRQTGNYYDTGLVIAGKDRHSLHPPNECMVASGWKILKTNEELITTPNSSYKVNVLHLKKTSGNKTIFGFYIYSWVCSKRIIPQYSHMLFYNVSDAISGETYRWAYPSTLVLKKDDEASEIALSRGLSFYQKYLDKTMSKELKNELSK